MLARAAETRRAEDALHAAARDLDALALDEELREVGVVEAGVPVLREGHDLGAELWVERVCGSVPAVAVAETGRVSVCSEEAGLEAPDGTLREVQVRAASATETLPATSLASTRARACTATSSFRSPGGLTKSLSS